MANVTKKYLDLNGLQYVLSKLSYTKPEGAGKFLTGLTESKGVISGTWADLAASDIPKLGTPTAYAAKTELANKVATITSTITRNAGNALEASFKLGVSGNLSLTRAENGDLTIGYAEKVSGVKTDGYLTLDDATKFLDVNSAKLANADTAADGADTLLTTKAYVDKQVNLAITGGVQYRGTTDTLPANPKNGDMWKLTAAITSITGSKAGDVIIYHTSGTAGWDLIPSGDDIEYTGVKVGTTEIVNPVTGGTVDFAAGEGLSVAGAAGKVTYSHAVPTGAAVKDLGFYKIATDNFGHVTGTTAVAKVDITGLLGDYVTSFGTKKGAVTLKNGYVAGTEDNGKINLTMIGNELNAAIVGLGSAAYAKTTDFAAAKHTHTATEISYDNTTSKLTATKVQGAIDELVTKIADVEANAGVTSFGGQKGDIAVNTTGAANGSINFSVDLVEKVPTLKGTVAGWSTKQDKIADSTAAIVTTAADSSVQTAAAENSTSTSIKNVTQTNGKIGVSTDAVVTFATISNKEIDALFAAS